MVVLAYAFGQFRFQMWHEDPRFIYPDILKPHF
jgi:hypothetical protein